MSSPKILITGANGQLGSELRVLSSGYPAYEFIFVTKEELRIDNALAVKNYFNSQNIQFCINCAAYTAVDKAESEKEKAFTINGNAVGILASACKERKAGFIHISTDYVFDGTASTPYREDHPVNPVNAYGASKLKGEELAFINNPQTIIIRTSWVYSSFGNNFVKTMLRLMKDRPSLNVVNDQLGCPTYAADLASAIMTIIEKGATPGNGPGIFNYSNEGVISWFQFADAIRELTNSKCIVNPIPSSQYPTPAKRPNYSVLDTTRIRETFRVSIPGWKHSLAKCLEILKKAESGQTT